MSCAHCLDMLRIGYKLCASPAFAHPTPQSWGCFVSWPEGPQAPCLPQTFKTPTSNPKPEPHKNPQRTKIRNGLGVRWRRLRVVEPSVMQIREPLVPKSPRVLDLQSCPRALVFRFRVLNGFYFGCLGLFLGLGLHTLGPNSKPEAGEPRQLRPVGHAPRRFLIIIFSFGL